MKKILTALLVTATVFTTGFNIYAQEADEYTDPEPSVEVKQDSSKKAKKPAKEKSDHPIKDFIFGKEKYIEYDEIELGTGTITYGNKQRDAIMLFNPKTGKAGVRTYYQTNFYNILFDEKARNMIATGYANYLEDFANKRLVRKNAKTKRVYGKIKADVEWGTLKAMMNNRGNTEAFIGYTFIDKSPYFCIIIKQTDNTAENMGEYRIKQSVEVQLYFTKAQGKEFVRQLSAETLAQYVEDDHEEETKTKIREENSKDDYGG